MNTKMKSTRRFNPHLMLMTASKFHLNTATRKEEGLKTLSEEARNLPSIYCGQFYDWMAAINHTAFAAEAFANTVGEELFPDWKETEIKEKPKQKFKKIAKKLKVCCDFGKHPWKELADLVYFRNEIVHAKPITVTEVHTDILSPRQTAPSWLEKQITAESAEQKYQAVREIIEIISEKLPDDLRIKISYDVATGSNIQATLADPI